MKKSSRGAGPRAWAEGIRECCVGRASRTHKRCPHCVALSSPQITPGGCSRSRNGGLSEAPCLLDAVSYLHILEQGLYAKVAFPGSRYGTRLSEVTFVWENSLEAIQHTKARFDQAAT